MDCESSQTLVAHLATSRCRHATLAPQRRFILGVSHTRKAPVSNTPTRRKFIQQSTALAASLSGVSGILAAKRAPAQITRDSNLPQAPWGIQIGDVHETRALLWSRADRDSRMVVEWSTNERFRGARVIRGPFALAVSDHTARVDLSGLPPGEEIFFRVAFESLDSSKVRGEPVEGRFRTPSRRRRPVRFLWTGDTAGQGWGIDLDQGGMRAYEAMRLTDPDFFIHSGDNVYADGPMVPEVKDAAGNVIWRNAFLEEIPEKLKVAESLHEFRRQYLYNRYDEHVRNFSAEVPQIWQWDDHEVTNNWSDSKVLDARYSERSTVQSLAANATRAFLEYAPIRPFDARESDRIYRQVSYGPDLDVFVLDMRSYRAANGCNVQDRRGPDTALLGPEQIAWLKRALQKSRATWKVIASDMPIGLIVGDGTDPTSGCARAENGANGDGPVLGREFEIAEILSFIKRECVKNTVWLTADVHYCAAHYYDPKQARFTDFEPFWEFVSGPIHAGSFGPNALDDTFGPQVIFQKAPPAGQSNLPPNAGLQFFGQVDIEPRSARLTVSLKDIDGVVVFTQSLEPR